MVVNLEVWTGWFLGSTTEDLKITQTRNNGVCSVLCVVASHKIAQTPMCRTNEVCVHMWWSVSELLQLLIPAVHVIHWRWQTGKHNLDLLIKAHATPVTATAGTNVTHWKGKHTILLLCPRKDQSKIVKSGKPVCPAFVSLFFTVYTTTDTHLFVLKKVSLFLVNLCSYWSILWFRGFSQNLHTQKNLIWAYKFKLWALQDSFSLVMEQVQCLNLDDMTDKAFGSLVSRLRREIFPCSHVLTGLHCARKITYESS